MLAENFKVFEGKHLREALIQLGQLRMNRLSGTGQLSCIVGGENERTPNVTVSRVLN